MYALDRDLLHKEINGIKLYLSKIAEVKYPFIYNKSFDVLLAERSFFTAFLEKYKIPMSSALNKMDTFSSTNPYFFIIKVYSNPNKVFVSSTSLKIIENEDIKIPLGNIFFNDIDDLNISIFIDDYIKRMISYKINNVFNNIFKYSIDIDEESWKLYNLGYYNYLNEKEYVENFVFDFMVVKDIRTFNDIVVTWGIKNKNSRINHNIFIQYYAPNNSLDFISLYRLEYDNYEEEKIKDNMEIVKKNNMWKNLIDRYSPTFERIKNINFDDFKYDTCIIFKEWKQQVEKYKKRLDIDFLKKQDVTISDYLVRVTYKGYIKDDDYFLYLSKENNPDFFVKYF